MFRRLLPVSPEDKVLDLGGGDGSHIAAILPEQRMWYNARRCWRGDMIHEGSGHFQRLIKEHLPQAQRILVVGCGRSGKEVVDLAQALPVICWRPIRAVLAPAVYCWARK